MATRKERRLKCRLRPPPPFPFFRRETTFSLVGGIEEEEEEEEEGRRGGGQLEKTRKNLKGGRDPGKLVAFTRRGLDRRWREGRDKAD